MFTAAEVAALVDLTKRWDYDPDDASTHYIIPEPDLSQYAAHFWEIYGKEDVFDQSVAKMADYFGYDIVILENMVGSHQVVTEVLDCRSRVDSFASLIYEEPRDFL